MKVRLDMMTRQTVEGDEELLRHQADGILREQSGISHLTYLLDGVHYEMWIDPARERVKVVRNWNEAQAILYQAGRMHTVLYETLAGAFEVSFHTKKVGIDDLGAGEMALYLSYDLLQFGQLLSECVVQIGIFGKVTES